MGLLKGKAGTATSSTKNKAWKPIRDALTPALGYVTQSGNMLSALLGMNGGPAQTQALDTFANSGGMQFLREQGNRQINTNMAAKGLLNSGAALKELTKYGQGLGSTYLNQYMDNISKFGGLGLGAGGLMAQAGQRSESTQTTPKKGLLELGANAAAAYFGAKSDRRLKKDIVKVGEYEDGLGIYEWTYKEGFDLPEGRFRGVMADEVKELRPQAYIPNIMGEYAGVNYGAL